MKNSTDIVTFDMDAIDHEHDIVPHVVIVPDYNGCPIVHVFITGERVLRMEPEDDWAYELQYPTNTAERQAAAALAYHLGGITEEQDQRLADAWGDWQGHSEVNTFDDVMSNPTDEGHAVVAWVGTVAQAVYERLLADDIFSPQAQPTGW